MILHIAIAVIISAIITTIGVTFILMFCGRADSDCDRMDALIPGIDDKEHP